MHVIIQIAFFPYPEADCDMQAERIAVPSDRVGFFPLHTLVFLFSSSLTNIPFLPSVFFFSPRLIDLTLP